MNKREFLKRIEQCDQSLPEYLRKKVLMDQMKRNVDQALKLPHSPKVEHKSWLERLGFITNKTIYKLLRKLMNDVEDIQNDLNTSNELLTNVSNDVASLLQQVAALSGGATAEQIAAIKASVIALKTRLGDVDAMEPPVPEAA